jgi:hypothetical protein
MILAAVVDQASGSTFDTVMGHVAQGFEALGAGILVLGVIWSFVLGAIAWRRSGRSAQAYLVLRQAWRRAAVSGAGTIRRAPASTLGGSGTNDVRS